MSDKGKLTVRIIRAGEAAQEYSCDSLRFLVPDGADESGGGWVGVRPGHEAMLAALAPGEILLFENDKTEPLRLAGGRGFLSVENDVIGIVIG